jgi:hypothetical protein
MSNWLQQILNKPSASYNYLPDIYPMPISNSIFVQKDVENIYVKILTDVVERTHGIPEKFSHLLWDNCLQSESKDGLVSLLAKAMEKKDELYIVFKAGVIRKATSEEQTLIRSDYETKGQSGVGFYVSFSNYSRTDMVKLYSGFEYCVLSSLNKSMNLSKAIQYKINDLRKSVALVDDDKAKTQAQDIANALKAGRDVYMDGKDAVETAAPNLEAAKASMDFLDSKRCFYLGMPRSYVNGELGASLGDTGKGDAKSIDRGLKSYFYSVVKPVVDAIFGVRSEFKSQDLDQITSALEVLKTFSLMSEELVSMENKIKIVNRVLNLPEDTKAGPKEAPVVRTPAPAVPNE